MTANIAHVYGCGQPDGPCVAGCKVIDPAPPVVAPAVCCGYCGKDEQDGVGIIVMGACDDCRRVWA